VFLTPDGEPFFAGTYFPPEQRQGMVSWSMVLRAVSEAWADRPDEVRAQADALTAAIKQSAVAVVADSAPVPPAALVEAVALLSQDFDGAESGWGGAPKFPPHGSLEFLEARAGGGAETPDAADALEMAVDTLSAMAAGGIYDQVGGGFARYAVDAHWTVPHFEKMLYDNALLARTYLHAWQVTREQRFVEVCVETLDWALREMRGPEGGFCSALDADSEGVEGKFYVWTVDQLRGALGDELGEMAIRYFGASPEGNFEEGANVLEAHDDAPERLPEIRCKLYGARAERVRPGLDDKRLTAWNALMISALADAGAVLERDDYLEAARVCAEFVLSELRDAENNLLRTWKDGRAALPAYLEDHAYLLQALLVLYEATFDERWYVEAIALADTMIERFADRDDGGFYTTAADVPHLVSRLKDLEDTPIPSGNSAAALGLLRLARLSGDGEYERQAAGVLALNAPLALRHPLAFGHLLQALDLYLATPREVAIVGAGPLTGALRTRYRPHLVLAGTDADSTAGTAVALLRERTTVDGRQAAYVCERFSCRLPVTELAALEALL
jgi:hypothetical protein